MFTCKFLKLLLYILCLTTLVFNRIFSQSLEHVKYGSNKNVGDISFDETMDNPNFILCDSNRVFQYYNLLDGGGYKGGRKALKKYFLENYKEVSNSSISKVFITIRFIVNCKGETGRFRISAIDSIYRPLKTYSKKVSEQLMDLTKKMNLCIPAKYKDKPCDYYQYITFMIRSGEIIEIAP